MSKDPEFQDAVKHRSREATGVVIAKYDSYFKGHKTALVDVRDDNGRRIYWASPAQNWETTRTRIEREGPDV